MTCKESGEGLAGQKGQGHAAGHKDREVRGAQHGGRDGGSMNLAGAVLTARRCASAALPRPRQGVTDFALLPASPVVWTRRAAGAKTLRDLTEALRQEVMASGSSVTKRLGGSTHFRSERVLE